MIKRITAILLLSLSPTIFADDLVNVPESSSITNLKTLPFSVRWERINNYISSISLLDSYGYFASKVRKNTKLRSESTYPNGAQYSRWVGTVYNKKSGKWLQLDGDIISNYLHAGYNIFESYPDKRQLDTQPNTITADTKQMKIVSQQSALQTLGNL